MLYLALSHTQGNHVAQEYLSINVLAFSSSCCAMRNENISECSAYLLSPFPSLQMIRTCPRLPEIVELFLDVVKSNPNKLTEADITAYLEHLFTFFFSPQSTKLEDNDVKWFLHHVNTLTSVCTSQDDMELSLDVDMIFQAEVGSVPAKGQSPLLNVLSTAMAKRLLRDILTHTQGSEKPVPPLHIFQKKVESLCRNT